MALTSFVANLTKITAVWLNKIDVLYVTVFGEAATKAQARAALTSDAPMALGEGGTGATTAGAARTTLGAAGVADNNAFTGTNTVPTQPAGDSSTKIASTAYANTAADGTIATAQALSGAGVTFSGIPSGTRRVVLGVWGINFSGPDAPFITLANTSSVAGNLNSVGTSFNNLWSGGGILGPVVGPSPATWSASIELVLINSATNTWLVTGTFTRTDSLYASYIVVGTVVLSQPISSITVGRTGAENYANGTANISYK